MGLIDTHTHLASSAFDGILNDVLVRADQAGLDRCLVVGTSLDNCQKVIDICRKHNNLYAVLGIHPHEADTVDSDSYTQLHQLAQFNKTVALGEMGLDFHYDFSPRDQQIASFELALDLAQKLNLPAVIHCREAFEDCMAVLKNGTNSDSRVVFHCFSGDIDQARPIIDRGYYLSFSGVVTFKKAPEIQEAAVWAPANRILIETDCPFLSPDPMRKIKPNEPALVVHVAEKLAQLRNTTLQEIAKITAANSRYFFSLPE